METPSQKCHIPSMAKHPKRPRDPNQLAKLIVDIATGQVEDREPTPEEQGKNPAAVALGRLGGIKGGKARADSLTSERRSQIAKKAATTRWAAKADKN
jgi:hypothetical protein